MTNEQIKAPKLWAIITSHSEVPGDHLILMTQPTEPTDAEVGEVIVAAGFEHEELESTSVTHCFDVEHWLKQYDNRRALMRWIAEGGLS